MVTCHQIRASYEWACRAEIDALKPGNVHRFADGHRMSADQFLASARVSASVLAERRLSAGQRILAAVEATRKAVGTNTNLGIILLCAPLACAAEMEGIELRAALASVLAAIDLEDSKAIFEAIVLAAPGGLGAAPSHDVRDAPRVTVVEAMRLAAERDLIARQYATDFQDVFEIGTSAFRRAEARGEKGMWPTVFTYLAFLANFPDSHVARKHGLDVAEQLRRCAAAILDDTQRTDDETERADKLMAFDSRLKERSLNPGTSADLTVATLFVQSLRSNLHNPYVDG